MVFTEILNFPFLVDKFAFFVLHLFFCNDPVVVDFLSLLLEVSEQFLLFFVGLLELSELFSHGELNSKWVTLYYYDSVSLTFFAWLTPSCSSSASNQTYLRGLALCFVGVSGWALTLQYKLYFCPIIQNIKYQFICKVRTCSNLFYNRMLRILIQTNIIDGKQAHEEIN